MMIKARNVLHSSCTVMQCSTFILAIVLSSLHSHSTLIQLFFIK